MCPNAQCAASRFAYDFLVVVFVDFLVIVFVDFFVLFVVIGFMHPFLVIVLVDFFVAVVLVRFGVSTSRLPMVHMGPLLEAMLEASQPAS